MSATTAFILWPAVCAERRSYQPRAVDEERISQGDLSELIDATRELINKQLRGWKAKGLVTHESDRIVLHDLATLRRLAQG